MSRTDRTLRHRTPDLRAGLATISLDPSPRLRAMRRDLRDHDPVADAWNNVAKALARAVRAVGRNLSKR